jgi:glutathione synthase/RimK-type ligase-like ATP-grasp enzyme
LPPTRHLRLAVASTAEFPELRPDWPLLQAALNELGVTATTQAWTDPAISWEDFDLVVANGVWDYIHHPDAFIDWVESVGRRTLLVNSPATLRWNMDKRYLADLANEGVATVPTTWLSPSANGSDVDFPPGEFVVKPSISCGAHETARYRPHELDVARAHIDRLLGAGQTVMLQPYHEAIDTQGETCLIFLGGRYSHCIDKSPILHPGAGVQVGLYDLQEISPQEPSDPQLQTAHSALAAAEHLTEATAYARVDLVTQADGTPAVLELELLEPALFFEHDPPAATRFAQVLRRLMT